MRFRLTTLLVAMAATILAFASPALAKGGGGRDNVSCAKITSFANTLGYVLGRPSISTAVTVTSTCADERPPVLAIAFRNDVTGRIEATSVTANPVLRTITAGFATDNGGAPYTIIATIQTSNGGGKILDTRSLSLTTMPLPAPPA
jgi:hypothetical protein